MPEYAGDVVSDALKEITVSAAENSIGSFESKAGLFYLNAVMDDLAISGINLGFTQVSSFSDDITIEDGAVDSVVKLTAAAMAPLFKSKITAIELVEQSEEAIDYLRDLSIDIGVSAYPMTLAVGSGNYDSDRYRFFGSADNDILTEVGGNIAPEKVSDDS